MRNAARLLRGTPPLFDRYSGYEDQLPAGPYDLAVVEHFWCASYATALRPRVGRLVLDLHNIESQLAGMGPRSQLDFTGYALDRRGWPADDYPVGVLAQGIWRVRPLNLECP